MKKDRKVIVECKPDEILAKALGLKRNEVVHQPNKGEVCNLLKKTDIQIAIIDEDPLSASQPLYLNSFTLVEEIYDVRYLLSKPENKIILVLKPRLEEWILKRCKETGVDPKNHHLPMDNKRFKDVINYHLNHFENMLHELNVKQDAGINYLKERIRQN